MRIAYASTSAISAFKIQDEEPSYIQVVKSDTEKVDINWGRRKANSELNPDISNVVNKHQMRRLFAENDVPTPRLYSEDEICALYVSGQTPKVVGRPDYHARKRGFWLIEDINDLNKALLGTHRKRAATHFMEYIEKERAPREYRVHIFNGKCIRLSEKAFTDDDKYTTVPPTGPLNHIREAARKAVASVGLDFGAVDVIASDDECWVLEVNSAPGLGGTMPEVYVRTFKDYIENVQTKVCEDCDSEVKQSQGRYYKYEPSIWLCDDCHDERMNDDE